MSDRLKDLQRQRALAQEQLAWFDREIAKESGQASGADCPSDPTTVAPVAPSASAPRPTPAPAPPSAAEAERLADEIIARYKDEQASSPADVKRGCFLYFGLAFLLVAVGLVALYFYSASRQ
jgi:CubicO group peptidase (beta-lactamase class C family)